MSFDFVRHSRCVIVIAVTLVMIASISSSAADDVIPHGPNTDRSFVDAGTTPQVGLSLNNNDLYLQRPTICGLCGRDPEQSAHIRPGDEVWLVSTRHQGCQCGYDVCVHRYEGGVGFLPSSIDEYFDSADPSVTVTTYVHGNRVDAQTACDRSFAIYALMARAANANQRLRHVIWSWPSSTIPGPIRDARVKATKTFLQSYILADFIGQHDHQTNVSLIGFSYGGRIIIGAQHLLGGGDLFGWSLVEGRCEQAPRPRVVVWAPAVPADWIHPGGFNGRALAAVDRMLLYFNTRDPLLRFYRKKLGESPADALGYRGICRPLLGDFAEAIEQYNAAESVGSQHKWTAFMTSREVTGQTVQFSLWSALR